MITAIMRHAIFIPIVASILQACQAQATSGIDLNQSTGVGGAQTVCATPKPEGGARFNQNQSIAEIDRILSDGKSKDIVVLFWDEYMIRVKQTSTGTRDTTNGNGFVMLMPGCVDIAPLDRTLSNYSFSRIDSLFQAGAKTEQELDARWEQDKRGSGESFPNEGSWARLTLANYTKTSARALVLALQNSVLVRGVQVLSVPAAN